jgi:hypothetical protein
MNASRPEADIEYSRGQDGSGAQSKAPDVSAGGRPSAIRIAVLGAGLLGAALLLAAEFLPLLQVHSSARAAVVKTTSTGSHQSYALVPVAALAVALAFSVWRSRNRFALVATGVLGLVALGIALLGDLPDALASGLIRTAAGSFAEATSSVSSGLYVETLGAIVLLITAAAGLLLLEAPPRPQRPAARKPSAARKRSAS